MPSPLASSRRSGWSGGVTSVAPFILLALLLVSVFSMRLTWLSSTDSKAQVPSTSTEASSLVSRDSELTIANSMMSMVRRSDEAGLHQQFGEQQNRRRLSESPREEAQEARPAVKVPLNMPQSESDVAAPPRKGLSMQPSPLSSLALGKASPSIPPTSPLATSPFRPFVVEASENNTVPFQGDSACHPQSVRNRWDRVRLGQTSLCTPVYFIGGGKAGSTTLACQLKDKGPDCSDPDASDVVHAGKEACWAITSPFPKEFFARFPACQNSPATQTSQRHSQTRSTSSSTNSHEPPLFALDACTAYLTETHARRISCAHPDTKLVMLVRDPVLQMISLYNDKIKHLGGGHRDKMVSQLKGNLDNPLWRYADTLEAFLKYFDHNQIIVVPTEAMMVDLQATSNMVTDFLGMPCRNISDPNARANSLRDDKAHQYLMPSKQGLKHIVAELQPWNERFFRLIGRRLPWLLSDEDVERFDAVGYQKHVQTSHT